MIRKITLFLFLLLGAVFFISCDEGEKPSSNSCIDGYDQEALFQNLSENVIIPSYSHLKDAVDQLKSSAESFVNNPQTSEFQKLKSNFLGAYSNFQGCSMFEFGPAKEAFLRNSLNNFPLNIEEVESKIGAGNYDFSSPDAYDKGFPALDYLLFGSAATEEEIIIRLTEDENTRNYLQRVVNDISERVDYVISAWTSGGYSEQFVANTGTAAGTSLSLIINSLNEHYELLKRDKIGIPSGTLTLGFPNPTKVEAYHSRVSTALATKALEASKRFFLGNSLQGQSGEGLDDLLDHVGATKDGVDLSQVIEQQYSRSIDALHSIDREPLSEMVESGDAVSEVYATISQQVVYLKTDMPSVLCVAITYVDNPSDSD